MCHQQWGINLLKRGYTDGTVSPWSSNFQSAEPPINQPTLLNLQNKKLEGNSELSVYKNLNLVFNLHIIYIYIYIFFVWRPITQPTEPHLQINNTQAIPGLVRPTQHSSNFIKQWNLPTHNTQATEYDHAISKFYHITVVFCYNNAKFGCLTS